MNEKAIVIGELTNANTNRKIKYTLLIIFVEKSLEKVSLRDFQESTKTTLLEGNSILIIAPTGLGKTLAAILPFRECTKKDFTKKIGYRIIYSLPIRALARGVYEEFKNNDIEAVIHHSEEPESKIFSERAIITTVDQYFTAFAGAPISWSPAKSHAAAGATLTSYAVFDEVHLLNPKNGLQLLSAILKLRNRWNLPIAVMTATLPNSVIDFLESKCGLKKIEVSQKDIQDRDSWRKVGIMLNEEELDIKGMAKLVREQYKEQRKLIVFVNTVDRAINLYKELKDDDTLKEKILLAHSRFSKQDRKRIEEEIHKRFGKNSEYEGILITTQVAEAGLNISAPVVITELAPMDSLIQRAGRCARFRENSREVRGKVIVVKPKVENGQWNAPYFDGVFVNKDGKVFIKKRGKEKRYVTLSELTWVTLRERCSKEIQLNWEKEKELVNVCLNAPYRSFINGKESIEVEELEKSETTEDKQLYDILESSKEILLEEG